MIDPDDAMIDDAIAPREIHFSDWSLWIKRIPMTTPTTFDNAMAVLVAIEALLDDEW